MKTLSRVIAAVGPALLLGTAFMLPARLATPALAQQEEDLTQGHKDMRQAYDRARERIDELDFAAGVRELQSIIEPRRAARAADLSLEEMKILTAAYDLRARAEINLGNPKAAESDFEALLRLDPNYAIDRQTLSPKVVDLFDKVRQRMVGLLKLTVEPPNARVRLDGEIVEARALEGIGLLTGSHELRVEMDGYDAAIETVSAAGGTKLERTVKLRPNRRVVEFITAPAGVRVTIDGKDLGATAGPATPDVQALAAQYQFDPGAASAPFVVPPIAAGMHTATFERDCYETQTLSVKVELDLEANRSLRFAPVVLKESKTQMQIASVPAGAEVQVDGARLGLTPLTVNTLCGGNRDITVVKQDVGRWTERVRLTPGVVNTLSVRLRPTLLYAGTFRLDEWGRVVWSDEDKPLLDALGRGLKTLNLVRLPQVQETLRDAIIKWMIADPRAPRAGTLLPPEILKDASERTGADLVLVGLTIANDPDHAWTLGLYSTLHPSPDIVRLRTDNDDGLRDLVARLDTLPPETSTWWGVGLADTTLPPGGPLVVRVLPGSPAAKSGLKAGDRIQVVGTRKVASTREALQAMESDSTHAGGVRSPVILTVDGGDGARTVRMAPGDAPALISAGAANLLYNRALEEFRLRARAAGDDASRGVAYLNVGIALMHFRAYERALSEGFRRADLPPGSGIAAGTVQYYRGLCALRRGDPSGAREAFKAAASAPGSTLESGDGPSAAAAATRALAALQ
jgi:tetratricopeptide (TPR) repeat protein